MFRVLIPCDIQRFFSIQDAFLLVIEVLKNQPKIEIEPSYGVPLMTKIRRIIFHSKSNVFAVEVEYFEFEVEYIKIEVENRKFEVENMNRSRKHESRSREEMHK